MFVVVYRVIVNSVDCSGSLLLFDYCSSACVLDYFACSFCVYALCAWFWLRVCRLLVIVCGLLFGRLGCLLFAEAWLACWVLCGLIVWLGHLWVCLLFSVVDGLFVG